VNALTQELSVHEIRQRTGHPLIDGDGHLIEVREAFAAFVSDNGGERLLDDPFARGLLVPGEEHRLLHEAYEQVEHGILTPVEFRDFTFTNAARFYGGTEPGFFAGTAVESAAREVAAGAGGPA